MPKEGRFYVEYLGWKETRGLHGSEYFDPVLRKLMAKRKSTGQLHRMTIKISKEELQISQEKTGSNGRSQKIRYPPQPMCDVSYVSQGVAPNTDVVGCIFLGYNAHTHCAIHVHAYRFDSADTATYFVKVMNSIIEKPEYRQRILGMENDLDQIGITRTGAHEAPLSPGRDTMRSDAGSYGSQSPNSSDSGVPRSYPTAGEALKARQDIVITRTPSQKKPEHPRLFSTLQDELVHKLSLQQESEAPILLPPKDYDTIVRRYGHLSIRAKVKQRSVIGDDSIFKNGAPETKHSAPSDGNNNGSKSNPRISNGHQLQQSASSSSVTDADAGSTHSSTDDDPSVYGLYKGLKQDDGYNSAQEEMVMWSPEFSFGSRSSASESSGYNSARSGLRRMKVGSSK